MPVSKNLSAGLAVALSVLINVSAQAAPVSTAFTDVPDGQWFVNHLQYLSDRNIVSGYPDNTFKPLKPVTRAEFATIIAKSQNLPSQPIGTSRFSDVPAGHWASGAIESAATQGWLTGYPNGTFGPAREITQAEMYTIVSKMVTSDITDAQVGQILSHFTDGSSVPGWAQKPVATALMAGAYVSEVTPNVLDPFNSASRADVATTVAKAMNTTFRTPVALNPTQEEPPTPVANEVSGEGRLTLGANNRWTITMRNGTVYNIPRNGIDATQFHSGDMVSFTGTTTDRENGRTMLRIESIELADRGGQNTNIVGVLRPTVEAGGWTVTADNGNKYTLFEIPPQARSANWFRPGATVRVSGDVRPNVPNIYMEGTPFFVDDISVRRRSAGGNAGF